MTSSDIKSLSLALSNAGSGHDQQMMDGSADDGKVKHPDEEAKQLLRQALAWFKTVPTALGRKRGAFPPEKFAALRSSEINLVTAKYALVNSNEKPVDVSLDGLPEEAIFRLASVLFWPSFELAYFWNGFFQIENKAQWRRELEQSYAVFKLHQQLDQDVAKRQGFLSMFRLFRGAMLREERKFKEADDELALLVPSVDFTATEPQNSERWAIEFGKYERGLCLWELGERKQAALWWNAVKDSGHALDARLKFRLKNALKRSTSSSSA